MKKTSFIAIAAMASLAMLSLSCQKNAGISDKEKALQLQAPSGQLIAATIHALKAEASEIVLNKFGKQDFQLTQIEYLPVTSGYAAIVYYQLEDGTTGNYGNFSEVKYVVPLPLETVTIPQKNKGVSNPGENAKVTISCVKKGSCECHLSATINADSGVITVSCGCSTCDVRVTES